MSSINYDLKISQTNRPYMHLVFSLISLSLISGSFAQTRLNNAINLYSDGKEFYQDGDYSKYLKKSLEAGDLLPYSRSVMYNIAAAYAVNDQTEKSFEAIAKLIRVDNRIAFDADSVFRSLKTNSKYSDYLKQSIDLSEPLSNSQIAFELDEKDLHPESVAYSETTGLFYISSMRKRKIVTYNPETKLTEDWISTDNLYDLYGVMGMKVYNGYLWFCSSPLPEMEGYQEDGEYTPTIFRVDLENKALVERFALPIGSVPGDLVLSNTGICYISDSALPRIFRIKEGQAQLFFDGDESLVNIQGLTINGNFLFIADYLIGIHRLTISDKSLVPISIDAPNNTAGTDGLYYYDNSLIAIQNGLYPFRITRYFLEDHLRVSSFSYYERASEYLDEPTLGIILEDEFYFVANSPWGYYDGNTILIDHIKKPQIRKLQLKN